VQLEMATMGFDHRILSARLLESWDLPRHLAEAISLPADADRIMEIPEEQRGLAQVLLLADLISQLLSGGSPQTLADVLDLAERFGGMDIHALEELVVELENKLPHLADVLSLDVGEQHYTDILWEAFESLSKIAEELAVEPGGESESNNQALHDALQKISGAPQSSNDVAAAPQDVASVPSQSPDPGLVGRLTAAVAACRHEREPISFVLIEADQFDDLVVTLGAERAAQEMMLMKGAIHTLSEQSRLCSVDDAQCALVLSGYDRQQAIELLRYVQNGVGDWVQSNIYLSFSAGLASLAFPPKNFPVQTLIDAAERCLYAAQASGGNTIKSIDVY